MISAQNSISKIASRLTGLACLFPFLLQAHPGHYHPGEEDEFDAMTAGFVHPLTGMDHLLLALAAGWLAFAWKGGRAALPVGAFLVALAGGAFAGRGMTGGTGVEIALAVTVMAAGFLFLKGLKGWVSGGFFVAVLAAAGFVHGLAHGAEAPAQFPFIAYAIGFSVGTALLVAAGAGLQAIAERVRQPVVTKFAGAALLVVGSVSLAQLF